ncbi:MAG: hypothetical protein WBD20_00070 [Pirellulaceae bacterium]
MGESRHLFTQEKYAEAAETVRPLLESGKASPAAIAFYGLAVAESQQDDRFKWWLTQVDGPTKQFPEYWSAIGIHLIQKTDYEGAIGTFEAR